MHVPSLLKGLMGRHLPRRLSRAMSASSSSSNRSSRGSVVVEVPAPPSPPFQPSPTDGKKHNPGTDLDVAWVASTVANKSGLERRSSELGGRRTVKKSHQAAWLLKAVSCIDLTTLSGDDTPGNVRR